MHPSTAERQNWKVCSGFHPACTMAPQEKDVRLIIGLSKYGETVPAMMMIDLGSLNGTIDVKCNSVDAVASIY